MLAWFLAPNIKKVWRSSEPKLAPENTDLDHEWLQLIQLEKKIDEQKKLLLATKTGHHGDLEEDSKLFWEAGESLVKRGDHLDDEDLEYVNHILSSFSRPTGNHEGSNKLTLTNATQKDAPACALTSRATPPKFNLKFNQKSTNGGSEENQFSYFSNIEDEGAIELGDYFSDDKEDDTEDRQDFKSENSFWSPTKFNSLGDKFPFSQTAFSEWNPVISSLETFKKERETEPNHISGLLDKNQLGFSTWQPFIPLEHVFQNSAAPLQPSDLLSQASSLQEPTLARISTISTSTEQTSSTMEPISPRLKVPLYRKLRKTEFPDLSKPPLQRLRARPCKPFYSPTYSATPTPRQPSFTNSSARSALLNHELPDHPERSTRFKLWKQQLQGLINTSQNQNTRLQNTPQAIDAGSEPQEPEELDLQDPGQLPRKKRPPSGSYETWQLHHFRSKQSAQWEKRSTFSPTQVHKVKQNTPQKSNATNANQVSTHSKSRTCWNTRSATSTATTRYWGRKLQKFYIRTPISRTKLWRITKHHQRSSKRIQSWPWSLKHSPHRCWLDTARTVRKHHKRKIYSQGENHFSKRRSESNNYTQQSESYSRYKRNKSKNDIQSENKDTEVNNEEELETLLKTAKAEMTAKADEVKAIEKILEEFRVEKEKPVDKRIETEASVTLPPHLATMSDSSIFTFTIFIFTFNFFISIFNPFVADPLDHHFQTFTIGDLSDCKLRHLSQQTASIQADTFVKTLANPDSIRPFKIPGTWSDLHYKSISRNPLVPSHLLSGRIRKSETKLYHDSFIFNYLDSTR